MDEKPIKVFKHTGILVNVKNLDQDRIDSAIKKWTVHLYKDKNCAKCEFIEDRPGENCENCASYEGARRLAKVVERGDQRLLSLPFGDTTRVRKFIRSLGRPYTVVDYTAKPTPLSRPIKMTIDLYPFQEEAKHAMIEANKGVLKAPPRAGKTVAAAAIVAELGLKTIIIASQRDWLNQFRETFIGSDTAKACTNARPGQIRFCKTFEDFASTDIALATPQQFMNPNGQKLLARISSLMPVMILDECFTKEHEVLTPNGYVPIADLHPGMQITSFNHATRQLETDTVAATKVSSRKTLVRVTIDGATYTCTPEHPFWCESLGRYVNAQGLKPGDMIRTPSSGPTQPHEIDITSSVDSPFVQNEAVKRVSSVEVIETDGTDVYDLQVSRNANFFVRPTGSSAQGALVHNCHLMPALATSRVIAQINARYRFGLSGTTERKQEGLYSIVESLIGPVVYEAKVERLRPRVELLHTNVTIKDPTGGDAGFARFVSSLEGNAQRRKKVVARVVRAVRDGHMVLLPVQRLRVVSKLVTEINQLYGKRIALPFTGQLNKATRPATIEAARTYKCKVLVGQIRLLSTGLNIPRASCLIEYTSSSNRPQAIQRVARILTPMEGKPEPLLIFVCDESGIMRKMRQNEFWSAIKPEFNPILSGPVYSDLLAWLSAKPNSRIPVGANVNEFI